MACGYVSIQVSMLFGRFEGGAISHGLSRDKCDDWTLFVELLVSIRQSWANSHTNIRVTRINTVPRLRI